IRAVSNQPLFGEGQSFMQLSEGDWSSAGEWHGRSQQRQQQPRASQKSQKAQQAWAHAAQQEQQRTPAGSNVPQREPHHAAIGAGTIGGVAPDVYDIGDEASMESSPASDAPGY